MTVAAVRAFVALVALAVVTLLPTASGVPSTAHWIGLAVVALAAALAVARATRQAVFLALTGLSLVLALLAPMDAGGSAERWWALAALPVVVPLAGLALVPWGRAAWLMTAGAVLAGPVRTLGYDPFLDPACRGCRSLPTALALPLSVADTLALVGGALVVLGLVDGLRPSSTRVPLAGLAAVGLWSLTGWSEVRGGVLEAAEVASLLASSGAGLLLARTLVTRGHLQRLADALESGTAPQASLRRALRDESLTLDFAVGPGEWADAAGQAPAGPATGQVTTPVVMGADVVARVHHAPDAGQADLLSVSLTPELRLAIEHARLTTQLEAQVRLLQASRARVVEAADETRRRLERDLHDGAQQELLALGFDLRRARDAAPHDACLERCLEEVTGALADLRSLASGVHPALLTTAGLGPALELARSRCPFDVRTVSLPEQRFAPVVERTAYLLVVDMAALGPVEVTGSVGDGWLRLQVTGVPLPPGSVVPERVAALGGDLVAAPGQTEVALPCV